MLVLVKKGIVSLGTEGPVETARRVVWGTAVRLSYFLPKSRLGDRLFSVIWFHYSHRRFPGSANLLNDVLHRIKTSDGILEPLRVFVSDKEYVKLYARAMLGERCTVPTMAVLKSAAEVDTFAFPPDCCIKPTQASGRIILRRNDAAIDKDEIKSWFALNYYDRSREANYRRLEPKIIVEPILDFSQVLDFKFFCHEGRPKIIQVGLKKDGKDLRRYYDPSWNEVVPTRLGKDVPRYERPEQLGEMLAAAEALCKPFSSVIRIDLYCSGGRILVGEITNCHWSAYDDFGGREFESELSRHILGQVGPADEHPYGTGNRAT
jgi:hypothetical protein